MAVRDITVSPSLEEGLWTMQNTRLLCDVYLKGKEPDAAEIPAHRAVLAARSPFFTAMFCSDMKESRQQHVQLQDIPRAALNLLVQYAYTSAVSVDGDNVVSLLEAAIFTQLQPLAETCWTFLERHADPDNCLLVYRLAERHLRCALAKKAKFLARRHFPTATQSAEFLQLEFDEVMVLLGSDHINVEREDVVLDAALSWIRHDPCQRTPMLADLLSVVRLTHVGPEHLQSVVAEFIGQMGCYGADLSDQIHQSIEAAYSIHKQPRESCDLSVVFVGFGRHVLCVDPRSGHATTLCDMPKGLQVTGTAVMGRSAFVLGESEGHPAMWRFDLDLLTWTSLAEPRSVHRAGDMVALAGCIFTMGGRADWHLEGIECYTPETNRWHLAASLPVPLAYFGYAVHQEIFFLFGGSKQRFGAAWGKDCIIRYDPTADVWTKCGKMTVPLFECSACLGDDMVYVLGGTSDLWLANSFNSYNPLTNEWLCKGELPIPGVGFAAGAADGQIYVLPLDPPKASIEIYDEMTQSWSIRSVLSLPNVLARLDISTCALVKMKKEVLRKCVNVEDPNVDAGDLGDLDDPDEYAA